MQQRSRKMRVMGAERLSVRGCRYSASRAAYCSTSGREMRLRMQPRLKEHQALRVKLGSATQSSNSCSQSVERFLSQQLDIRLRQIYQFRSSILLRCIAQSARVWRTSVQGLDRASLVQRIRIIRHIYMYCVSGVY
jgi:hypothetical protein